MQVRVKLIEALPRIIAECVKPMQAAGRRHDQAAPVEPKAKN